MTPKGREEIRGVGDIMSLIAIMTGGWHENYYLIIFGIAAIIMNGLHGIREAIKALNKEPGNER